MPDELEQYELHHRARIAIKPGITGMWQVSGRSDITDFEEIVRLDTEYISQWNIGLDIKILFKAYSYVDAYICCSYFLKSKLDTQKRFRDKTIGLHNFKKEIPY